MKDHDMADGEGAAPLTGNGRPSRKGSSALLLWLSQLARGALEIDGPAHTDLLAQMPKKLGPYRLERLLGQGAFGVVFRAFDTALGRHVALKVAWPYVMYDPKASKRFVEEPKAAAALDHAGIVKVYRSGWVGSVSYIALELVDGPSLSEWLKRQDHAPARLAAHVMREVAEAVQFIHANGLIHRDVKPSNILLKPGLGIEEFSYQPVVTDLGLARRVHAPNASDATAVHAIVGTDYYMSPEQAAGQKAEARSDIFSLGVVLYELVCGRRPFDGVRSEQVREQIRFDDPPPIRSFRKRVPRELEAIILKCLEKSPSRRYSSAQDLADDLGNFLSGKPVQAGSSTHWERFWKRVQRNPAESLLVAGAMASVILFAGLMGAWVRDKAAAAQQITAAEAVEHQHRCAANIRQAAAAQKRGGRGEVSRLLKECRSLAGERARMGIEWDFLWSLVNEEDRTLPAHQGSVHSVRFSPRGDLLFSAGEDGRVIAWETSNWTRRYELNDKMHEVNVAEISADGSLLAVASDEGRVVVHRTEDGTIIYDQPIVDGQAFALAWLGDRSEFAVGGSKAIVSIVNPVSGEVRQSSALAASAGAVARDPDHPVEIQALEYLPNDESLAVAVAPGGLCVLDAATLKEINRFDQKSFSAIRSICHVPVGPGYLAITYFSYVQLWNLRDRIKAFEFAIDAEPMSLRYSNASRTLVATLRNGDAHAWSIEKVTGSDRPVGRRIHAHNGRSTTVDISPDGNWMATGGNDKLIRLWGKRVIGCPFDVFLENMPRRIEFSPCGRWMSIVDSPADRPEQVILYDANNFHPLWSTEDASLSNENLPFRECHLVSAAFHPTKPLVLCLESDRVIRSRDCADGQVLETHRLSSAEDYGFLGFTPNAESLLLRSNKTGPFLLDQSSNEVSYDEPLSLWTLGKFRTTRGDLWLDSKSGEQTFLRISPTAPPLLTLPGLSEGALVATLSPDRRYLAAASADSIVCVWDLDNVAAFAKLIGHEGRPEKIQFSNDGNTLLSHSFFDGTVRFWHLPTRTELLKVGDQDARIVSMGLNPAGNLLVFGVECNGRYGLRIHRLGMSQAELVANSKVRQTD